LFILDPSILRSDSIVTKQAALANCCLRANNPEVVGVGRMTEWIAGSSRCGVELIAAGGEEN